MSAIDVLVIGGGQAGLASARWLRQFGLSIRVIDAADRVGDRWRRRYKSLTLFTPRRFSSLPGLEIGGDPAGYASGAEFGDYLERYSRTLALPVTSGVEVERLVKDGERFIATLSNGAMLEASRVVVASGGFQRPTVPPMAAGLSAEVRQLNAETYRQPSDVAEGKAVLVVGDGASGRDIAADLAGRERIALACGRPRRLLPETVLGIGTWTWLKALGLLGAATNSPIGRFMRKADPFPNRQRDLADLQHLGVAIKPRAVSAHGQSVTFADGSVMEIGTVIWALGYRDHTGWLDIDGAIGADGGFLHTAGRSPVDGLFFVGRPWQRNRASALIMGVDADAGIIARHIAASMGRDARPKLVKALRLA